MTKKPEPAPLLDDPFSAEADPYPSAEPAPEIRVQRRAALHALGALAALAAVPATASCVPFRRACEPEGEGEPAGCKHRFCRYYRGAKAYGPK